MGQPPAGFSFGRTGGGRVGHWIVQSASDAPSPPNVLAQVASDRTDYRFPVAAALSPSFTDGSVSVKCKAVSGHVDRACGLVFRYGDENNYYLTRANALEDNVRFYYVKNGRRIQLANWSGKVTSGVWHELNVAFEGDHVEAYWDGMKRIDAHDRTFSGPGRVGVWTKAVARRRQPSLASPNSLKTQRPALVCAGRHGLRIESSTTEVRWRRTQS